MNHLQMNQFQLRSDFHLNNKDVVSLFVNHTENWYTDPFNSLFRKKAQVYNMLLHWLETGKELPNMPVEMIYVLNKFQLEWFEPRRSGTILEKV